MVSPSTLLRQGTHTLTTQDLCAYGTATDDASQSSLVQGYAHSDAGVIDPTKHDRHDERMVRSF